MKYIIDIPKGVLWIQYLMPTPSGTHNLKSESVLQLTEYTESDRKAIENEVWEFAKEVRLEEFIDEEGRLHGYISGFNSYSEAKAKYEVWLKRKEDEEIKKKVIDLAEEIGIHKLYSIVREIRGE